MSNESTASITTERKRRNKKKKKLGWRERRMKILFWFNSFFYLF